MDFQSAMETFAEAWVAANTKGVDTQSQALALTTPREGRTPPASPMTPPLPSPPPQPPSPRDGPACDDPKTTSSRSLPVHCVVETVWTVQQWKGSPRASRKAVLETDSFVIIPVNTPFQELVHVALQRLGYPKDTAAAAKGSVVIKNWKPLSFDKISDNPATTVGDILSELTTVATLRIQIFRSRPSILSDMKDKLLRLLLVQSHTSLLSSGCPLDEVTMSQLIRNQAAPLQLAEPSEETRRKFEQWWTTQLGQYMSPRPHARQLQWHSPPPPPQHEIERRPSSEKLSPEDSDRIHPALQTVQSQYPTQKTRMRTSFDPELELPKLQRWFCENQHPSRQQIQQYVKELNSLDSRRGRKPLDVNNVVYWFKNARAAQKRAEVRNLAPGMHCQLSLNGYNSQSQSPSDGAMMGYKSPTSPNQEDEEEEEQTGPLSPIAPLSLTTNRVANLTSRSPIRHTESPSHAEVPLKSRKEEMVPRPPQFKKDQPPEIRIIQKCIKQEPLDHLVHRRDSQSPSHNHHNNNNNNENKEGSSELYEDDEEDDVEEGLSDGEESSKGGEGGTLQTSPADLRGTSAVNNAFPIVPNPMFSHSIMYMSHYIPGLNPQYSGPQGLNLSALADERRKRNRTFIDPVSEVPRLEQWFALNTHPSHNLILKYTDDLNRMPYRQKFPRLEPKNVQFWFKNRRAKCKRLKMSLFDSPGGGLSTQQSYHHHLATALSGDAYAPVNLADNLKN